MGVHTRPRSLSRLSDNDSRISCSRTVGGEEAVEVVVVVVEVVGRKKRKKSGQGNTRTLKFEERIKKWKWKERREEEVNTPPPLLPISLFPPSLQLAVSQSRGVQQQDSRQSSERQGKEKNIKKRKERERGREKERSDPLPSYPVCVCFLCVWAPERWEQPHHHVPACPSSSSFSSFVS